MGCIYTFCKYLVNFGFAMLELLTKTVWPICNYPVILNITTVTSKSCVSVLSQVTIMFNIKHAWALSCMFPSLYRLRCAPSWWWPYKWVSVLKACYHYNHWIKKLPKVFLNENKACILINQLNKMGVRQHYFYTTSCFMLPTISGIARMKKLHRHSMGTLSECLTRIC